MLTRRIFIFAAFFILTVPVFGQNKLFKRIYFEPSYNYGFVAPHHDFMAYFITEHVQGFQLNVGIMTSGEKAWHQQFNYPKTGIGFYHSGLGNKDVYGNLNAVYAYFDRMFLPNRCMFNIGNRISAGGAYLNKRFDLNSNPFNLAIGSRLNVFVRYDLEATAKLTSLMNLKLGMGLTHVSNGNFIEPNKGLNSITGFTAIQYFLSKNRTYQRVSDSIQTSKYEFLIAGSFGRKAISRLNNLTYPVVAVSVEFLQRIRPTGYACIGFNSYYDPSILKERKLTLNDSTALPFQNTRVALNIGYEMRMSHLGILVQPGVYLKNSFRQTGWMSNRLGVRYFFNSGVMAGVIIKAHWPAIADVIEWTVGYRWRK